MNTYGAELMVGAYKRRSDGVKVKIVRGAGSSEYAAYVNGKRVSGLTRSQAMTLARS